MRHVLIENRHGLVVNTRLTPATGTAEREAAITLVDGRPTTRGITLRGDKNYDTQQFVQDLRAVHVTPHVAQHTTHRTSAIDGRTTRHAGYSVSQQKRKWVDVKGHPNLVVHQFEIASACSTSPTISSIVQT